MTINEAYLYAKKLLSKNFTHTELETFMKLEGHSEESISKVKYWLIKLNKCPTLIFHR